MHLDLDQLFVGHPVLKRQLEIAERLEDIAPDLMAWKRMPTEQRGPQPALPQEHRAEALKLLTEFADLVGERQTAE